MVRLAGSLWSSTRLTQSLLQPAKLALSKCFRCRTNMVGASDASSIRSATNGNRQTNGSWPPARGTSPERPSPYLIRWIRTGGRSSPASDRPSAHAVGLGRHRVTIAVMTSRISHTTIDCLNAFELSGWWKQVVGYTDIPGDPNEAGDEECMIVDPFTGHRLLSSRSPTARRSRTGSISISHRPIVSGTTKSRVSLLSARGR